MTTDDLSRAPEWAESLEALRRYVVLLFEADPPVADAAAILLHAYASGAIPWSAFGTRARQLLRQGN